MPGAAHSGALHCGFCAVFENDSWPLKCWCVFISFFLFCFLAGLNCPCGWWSIFGQNGTGERVFCDWRLHKANLTCIASGKKSSRQEYVILRNNFFFSIGFVGTCLGLFVADTSFLHQGHSSWTTSELKWSGNRLICKTSPLLLQLFHGPSHQLRPTSVNVECAASLR